MLVAQRRTPHLSFYLKWGVLFGRDMYEDRGECLLDGRELQI